MGFEAKAWKGEYATIYYVYSLFILSRLLMYAYNLVISNLDEVDCLTSISKLIWVKIEVWTKILIRKQ